MKMDSETGNGAKCFSHSGEHLLEFFSKGGSIRSGKTYYADKATDVLELFKNAWRSCRTDADRVDCMKLLFWCRDCR